METPDSPAFETWAVIELFGHTALAGHVMEEVIAGCGLLKVEVPEVDGEGGFVRYFGPKAVFSISPCSEAEAHAAVIVLGVPRLPLGLENIAVGDPSGDPAGDPFLDPFRE